MVLLQQIVRHVCEVKVSAKITSEWSIQEMSEYHNMANAETLSFHQEPMVTMSQTAACNIGATDSGQQLTLQ